MFGFPLVRYQQSVAPIKQRACRLPRNLSRLVFACHVVSPSCKRKQAVVIPDGERKRADGPIS